MCTSFRMAFFSRKHTSNMDFARLSPCVYVQLHSAHTWHTCTRSLTCTHAQYFRAMTSVPPSKLRLLYKFLLQFLHCWSRNERMFGITIEYLPFKYKYVEVYSCIFPAGGVHKQTNSRRPTPNMSEREREDICYDHKNFFYWIWKYGGIIQLIYLRVNIVDFYLLHSTLGLT